MKPVVYSSTKAVKEKIGWHRAGDNISYFQSGILKSTHTIEQFRTLQFSYTFSHSNDTVWFAYCYPYFYSQLTEFLNKVEADPIISEYKFNPF